MSPAIRRALIANSVILIIAVGLAYAGGTNGHMVGSLPVFTLCILISFAINWLVFIPAFLNKTEKFFDLTGAITNTTLPLVAVLLVPSADARSWLLFALITIWAIRLGSFLFQRVMADGHDTRFIELKKSGPRFFTVWSIQALWCSFTLAAALAAITSVNQQPIGAVGIIGLLVWIIGFGIEVMADRQKTVFRANKANRSKFISTGLWAWSRHPNYFGEIVLWLGVAIIASPTLTGLQWVTMISPIFVIVLLMRISGVPLLEAKADKKWGGQADYEAYKANTPVLIPRPPKS